MFSIKTKIFILLCNETVFLQKLQLTSFCRTIFNLFSGLLLFSHIRYFNENQKKTLICLPTLSYWPRGNTKMSEVCVFLPRSSFQCHREVASLLDQHPNDSLASINHEIATNLFRVFFLCNQLWGLHRTQDTSVRLQHDRNVSHFVLKLFRKTLTIFLGSKKYIIKHEHLWF